MKGFLFPLLCAALLPAFFSCSNQVREERKTMMPADSVIPELVMVQLLADVHILEAGLLVKRNHGEKISGLSDLYYQTLLKKYGISDVRFSSNLKYYQWDPDEYKALYEKVIAELKARNNWIPASKTTKSTAED
jgi:hypothetical protein